jgi:hypothetical protein
MAPRPIRVSTRKAPSAPPQFRAALSAGAMVFVFAGLALGAMIWVPSMESRLASRAAGSQPKINIQWPVADPADKGDPTKSWVPMPVRDELMALACREVDRHSDPFSPAGLRAISDSLSRTGWFEQVSSVTRTGDAINFTASWRTPAAVVRRNGVDYLISSGGYLLPVSYQRGQAPVIAIVGASQEPPMVGGQLAPGLVWDGDDIRAALDTIALISTRSWRPQVTAIDISDYAAKKKLSLVTKWNGRAVLGGGPRDTTPGEVAIDVKIKRLDELVRQFGQIDAKHRLVEVAGPVMLVDDVGATAQLP